jgi:hypothetical protein
MQAAVAIPYEIISIILINTKKKRECLKRVLEKETKAFVAITSLSH